MENNVLMFTTTLGSAAVVGALSMVYYSIKSRSELHKNHKTVHAILTGLIFGLFSVYCTVSSVPINGALCNCRDLPPLYAGMVAGPIAGILAGIIGAAYRYFVVGGMAALPCAIGCLSASIIGSVLHIVFRKHKEYSVILGVAGSIIAEVIHLIVATAFGLGDTAKITAFPMIFANAAGMTFCMYMYNCCKPENRD